MAAEPERSSSTEASAAGAGAYATAALFSARDYVVLYPPAVLAFSTVPRVVLQVAFLSYLGYYAAGEDGRTFAFIGAAAQVMTIATVVKAPSLILEERISGTLQRVRSGVVSLPGVIAARWLVYAVEGCAMSVLAVLALAGPFGGRNLLERLLGALPLFALLAVTTSAFGLVVGSFALTQRADALITNLGGYSLLAVCGAVAPLSALGDVGSRLARAIPLTNGLLALRNLVDGRAWVGDALLEVAVGAAWALVAVALLARQDRRSRRLGSDDFV